MSKKDSSDQEITLEDQQVVEEVQTSNKKVIIALYGLLFLLSAVGNAVFNIKCIQSAANYSIFVSTITSFVYTPIFLGVVLYSNHTGEITDNMKAYPKFKYFVMSILEGGGGAVYMIGLTKTIGALAVVLQQMGIPLTLIVATIMLRARFHYFQYIGSLVIMGGVGVFNLSKVTGEDDSSSNNIIFNAFVMIGVLFMCISSVYKEIAFKGVDLDVNLVQYWVAYMQFFITIVCLPLQSLPIFPDGERVDLADLPKNLYDGARCVFQGHNTKFTDDCGDAFFNTAMYTIFNILYNVFTLLLIKHASASFVQVLSAARLPLATALMYSSVVMGDKATKFSWWHVGGVAVILSGIVSYRIGGFMNAKNQQPDEVLAGDMINPAESGITQSFLQGETKSHKSTFVQSFVGGGQSVRDVNPNSANAGESNMQENLIRRRHK